MQMYGIVSYKDLEYKSKLKDAFRIYGVVVITDVLDKPQCDQFVDQLVGVVENLGSGVRRTNCKSTWINEKLPPQTRVGQFQCALGNTDVGWQIRSHPHIFNIFSTLYSDVREKTYNLYSDFIVSGDGINLRPTNIDDYSVKPNDWPHLDQTDRSDIFKCIQGQMVLTNTSASFVASPKSHLVFNQILDYYNISHNNKTNWIRIINGAETKISNVISMVENAGGTWQIPILAPAGSFIVWASSIVHSARMQQHNEKPNKVDQWLGWRAVIYVSYRPKEDLQYHEIIERQNAFIENRTTNHWSTKTFKKVPHGSPNGITYEQSIREIVNDPAILYRKNIIKPIITQNCKDLMGFAQITHEEMS